MEPWTKRAIAFAIASPILFGLAIVLIRDSASFAGQVGGACLLAAPASALAGVACAAVALRRKEPRRPAALALAASAVLAAFFVLFLWLLLEAIRNFT